MSHIHWILPGAIVILAATLISLRRSHIRVEYSFTWLIVGLALLLAGLFPQVVVRLSAELGIDSSVGFLVLSGTLALAILFEVSMVVSTIRDENIRLIQRLAILEYQLRHLQSDRGSEAK